MSKADEENRVSEEIVEPLSDADLVAMIAQIDANVAALMADGKLAAVRYDVGGDGPSADRRAGLDGLLAARRAYQELLDRRGGWEETLYEPG